MPLWDPYDDNLKSDVADLANAASTPMAGAIHAALFMRRFVPDEIRWAHLDTWAWREAGQSRAVQRAVKLGLRAVFEALEGLYPQWLKRRFAEDTGLAGPPCNIPARYRFVRATRHEDGD